jgi:V-type H+-transporting ATPase subunit a
VLNDFTRIPQLIIDTYGVPTYKEVNPAIFACVTFPFFFGVMFGDVMHGFLLLAFSTYLCVRPKPAASWDPLHEARYFLLLSGIFATFCGIIYNDFSSMGTMIAGESCYTHFGDTPKGDDDFVVAKQKPNCVYPFGFDPIWYRSE